MGKSLIILIAMTLLLGGCSQSMNVSAEEIIHQVMESEEDMGAYYGESVMKLFEGDTLVMDSITEEYVSEDGKRKLVTVDYATNQEFSVMNDGEKMLMYDKEKGEAFEADFGMDAPNVKSAKEQIKVMIESVKDSHNYELVDEGEVLRHDTYHLQLQAKNEDHLIGDMDLWIDKKTWFILKMKAITGDARSELEYTKLDLSPAFEEGTFTLDIPEDVVIGNFLESFGPDPVTISEAEEALGSPFLLFPEDEVVMSALQIYDYSEGLGRYKIEVSYDSKANVPLFMMSIFPAPEDMPIKNTELKIRGNHAEYEDSINSIMWDEEGIRYNIILSNPDIEIEEIMSLTENMFLSSEK